MISTKLGFKRRRSDTDDLQVIASPLLGYSGDPLGWHPGSHSLLAPITTSTAMTNHLTGRAYARVERHAHELIVVSIVNHHEIRVTRYDHTASVPVEFREFRESDGRLWLRGIKRTNAAPWVPHTRQITDWFTWVRPATTATWTRFDASAPQGREVARRTDWSPEPHWYDRVTFGDYTELIGHANLLRELWPEAGPLELTGP